MKYPPHQKCICWNLDRKTPANEKEALIEEGNVVTETTVAGYCPCCGYKFNLTILNVNTNTLWEEARMSCPHCHSEGMAIQYNIAHKKMVIKCYWYVFVLATLVFVIMNIIKTCS